MTLLYHCFPRKKKPLGASKANLNDSTFSQNEWQRALTVFSNILEDGIYLTEETICIPWDDPFGHHKSKRTSMIQYRFCLTSLTKEEDLRDHCQVFGKIGLGFELNDIRRLGGFPVFYLPSPACDASENVERLNYTGVSLLYRLVEIQSVLENVNHLPASHRRTLLANVADFDNMMGALRFLGNMLYFTDHLKEKDETVLRYYQQREWRLVAGLGNQQAMTEEIEFNQKPAFALRALEDVPIKSLIREVVVAGNPDNKSEIEAILRIHQLQTPVRLIHP